MTIENIKINAQEIHKVLKEIVVFTKTSNQSDRLFIESVNILMAAWNAKDANKVKDRLVKIQDLVSKCHKNGNYEGATELFKSLIEINRKIRGEEPRAW